MPLPPNTQFGQYRIVRLLGRGGMGEVYEAEHRVLRKRYALKLLPEDFAARPEGVRRFEREAAVMANLEHPHIVRVDEFGQTAGRYWLRMELVKGVEPVGEHSTLNIQHSTSNIQGVRCVSLADYAAARGGRIEQGEFAEILRQILEALAYAHGKGVVHRDLKPGNVLLERDGEGGLVVKVSDFGLARVVGEEFLRSAAQVSVSRSLGEAPTLGRQKSLGEEATVGEGEGTSTRALLGTWEYMSPEQRRGEEADARSDVYAVGLMCYRLLTGRELGVRLPSQVNKSLAAAWDEFVARALEQEAGERYADGREMLAACGEVVKAVAVAEEARRQEALKRAEEERKRQEAEAARARQWRRMRRGLVWAMAVVAIVLVVRVAWYWGVELPVQRWKEVKEAQRREEQRRATVAKLYANAKAGSPQFATKERPWSNSLGMLFVPVPGNEVLFCIWETRVKDYRAYAQANSGVDGSWKNPTREGKPVTPSEDCPVVNVSWEDAKAFCEWLTKKERQMGLIGPDQSYRLPMDWEWSVAVGLGEGREGTPASKDRKIGEVYPWGMEWPPPRGAGNYADATARRAFGDWSVVEGYEDGYATTAPVGSLAPNIFGLYDMGGNVWEWCEDSFDGQSGGRV